MNPLFNQENIVELEPSPETLSVSGEVPHQPIPSDRLEEARDNAVGVSAETAEIFKFSRVLAATGTDINELIVRQVNVANGEDNDEIAA